MSNPETSAPDPLRRDRREIVQRAIEHLRTTGEAELLAQLDRTDLERRFRENPAALAEDLADTLERWEPVPVPDGNWWVAVRQRQAWKMARKVLWAAEQEG